MHPDVRALVSEVHDSGRKLVVATTGGGATLAGWLLGVPGGSRTVVEAVVPYAERALCEWLGRAPASFCSRDAALLMARRARERAAWLAPGEPAVGLACTASLRSDRPKHGDHRAHLAACADEGALLVSLTLAKERRAREEEEEVVSRLLLNLLSEALALPGRCPVSLLEGETVERAVEPGDPLAALATGDVTAVCVESDGRLRQEGPAPSLLLPGSFNPLHEGHLTLAAVAARRTGRPAAFELTAVNADKPPLSAAELRRRAGQFLGRAPLWLTRAPTFPEKARLFPGATFVVGADTASRIVQPRFYGGSEEAMHRALGEFAERGCRFLVAGRADASGRFLALDALAVPAALRGLFDAIPEADFRCDMSSTALRQGGS